MLRQRTFVSCKCKMGFLEIEQAGKQVFEQFPMIKKLAKRVYQGVRVLLTKDKYKCKGNVQRITPEDGYEYFYGYYDKSPWDKNDRYVIALKVRNAYKSVAPKEVGIVGVIDTKCSNTFIEIGKTRAWNVQQGCMAQWVGPDFSKYIIYNDFRNGKYCSVLYNFLEKKEEKVLPYAVYDIDKNGTYILSLDFSRLHRLRPGYGYSNIVDDTADDLCPDQTCIWKVDINDLNVTELFNYTDFKNFEHNESMDGAEHKINHIMISPNGKRFMVLHRWFKNGKKHSRLITVNVDKSEMYNLSDDIFVSHCFWKNDDEILAFLRKKNTGDHYYLMKDKSQKYKLYWDNLRTDGHCSYSPNSRYIITDTYPNRKRYASVFLCTEDHNTSVKLASMFSPFKYDNDCRCDLHPRWNREGTSVCIDSVHEGKRGIYRINIFKERIMNMNDSVLASVIIPYFNAKDTLPMTIESLSKQSYKNFEVIIVDDGSDEDIITLVNDFKRKYGLSITLIHQVNLGVSAARNKGINNARGKYLFFLDSDDVYHQEFLKESIYQMENYELDTVIFKQDRDIQSLLNREKNTSHTGEKASSKELLEYFMFNKENIHFGGIIYKAEIIKLNSIYFTEGTMYGEDLEFALKYLVNCNRGIISQEKMYGYYNNPTSAVNTVKWEKTNLVDAMIRVEKYMKEQKSVGYDLFVSYMLPRTAWTTAKTFAKGKNKQYYNQFLKTYDVNVYMKRLIKSSKNKLLKLSSILFCISKNIFYYTIGIIYKNK